MEAETNYDRRKRLLERYCQNPRIVALIDSGRLSKVVSLLRNKRRLAPFEEAPTPLDEWILGAVSFAIAEPDIAESMTGAQRKSASASVIKNAKALSEALAPFRSATGLKWPFQPILDRLALHRQLKEEERLADAGNPMDEDTAHRCRYAIYNFVMNDLDELFDALVESAEMFAETDTVLKRPNDANAERLYFIRQLNKKLCTEFRSPCRAAALELTSAFFDCSDLDEAALTKLAPFYRPTPIQAPDEVIELMIEYGKRKGDPDYFARFMRHIENESTWGMGREDSAE